MAFHLPTFELISAIPICETYGLGDNVGDRIPCTEVMAWRLYGVCQPCSGRGYQLILGTPMLSNDLCKHCLGTGKVPLPRGEGHTWLVGEIDQLIARAAGVMMKKLAAEMDLD